MGPGSTLHPGFLFHAPVVEVLVQERCTTAFRMIPGTNAYRNRLGNPLGSWLDIPPAGRDTSDSPLLGDQWRGGSIG